MLSTSTCRLGRPSIAWQLQRCYETFASQQQRYSYSCSRIHTKCSSYFTRPCMRIRMTTLAKCTLGGVNAVAPTRAFAARPIPQAAIAASNKRVEKIRNIGIIAHIDAGKTTTTERLLYYSEQIRRLGDVDRGDSTMDFLPAERERGITIKAATASIKWNGHDIHIIDTPGHVDFTEEVNCSLRVMDSCVLLLDGVKGVQAQTYTVYRQAQRYSLPCIAFVNKMDRENASLKYSATSIEKQLKIPTLLLQIPVKEDDTSTLSPFAGIIDLIELEEWAWDNDSLCDGKAYLKTVVTSQHPLYKEMLDEREQLIQRAAELDDNFLPFYLEYVDQFTDSNHENLKISEFEIRLRKALHESIRKIVANNLAIPVLCGASYQNCAVQPLLNAIIRYCPSPLDRPLSMTHAIAEKNQYVKVKNTDLSKPPQRIPNDNEMLTAVAFKVTHDMTRAGLPIVYVRVYSGVLKEKEQLVNTSASHRNTLVHRSLMKVEGEGEEDNFEFHRERPLKILNVAGEKTTEISSIATGCIGALVGLKHTFAGDTLVKHSEPPYVRMESVKHSAPVFFASIEADSRSDEPHLQNALICMQREDPSVQVSLDNDTGQTLIAGMGELHLELTFRRLVEDFKVKATLGKMRVSYRECVTEPVTGALDSVIPNIFGLNPSSGASPTPEVVLKFTISPLPPLSGIVLDIESANQMPMNEASSIVSRSHAPVPGSTVSLNGSAYCVPPSPLQVSAIATGIHTALARGPILGYACTDVKVTLDSYFISSPSALKAAQSCATRAILNILNEASENGVATLLEPIMLAEISVGVSYTGDVVSDLTSRRRGNVRHVDGSRSAADGRTEVIAEVPLAEILGYASSLRSFSAGTGNFSMEFFTYQPVPSYLQQKLIENPP